MRRETYTDRAVTRQSALRLAATARRQNRVRNDRRVRATEDRLFKATTRHVMAGGQMTLGIADYVLRKKDAIAAYYFSRTYGRPFYATEKN